MMAAGRGRQPLTAHGMLLSLLFSPFGWSFVCVSQFTGFLLRAPASLHSGGRDHWRDQKPGSCQDRTMASGGSDLSTRTSSEDQNRDHQQIREAALKHFRKCKVAIADAIRHQFPFLEILRDHGFITDETYEESRRKRSTVQEMAYDVLTKLEETFDLSLLAVLFSKVMMKSYSGLEYIYKSFRDVIRDKSFLPEIADEEMDEWRAILPNMEQVTSSNLSELSEREDTHEVTRPGPEIAPGVSSGEEARTERSQASDMMDTTNLGNNSALQKAKGRKRSRRYTDGSVNFQSDVLPVTCGEMKGYLIKRKLERGGTVKSIRGEDGNWFTPREFEVAGGYEKSSNWKLSVHCGGKTLKTLMEEGFLPMPPITHSRKNEQENSYICEICQDGGKLFCCGTCSKYFHEKCHIPPVETDRRSWSCTFCKMKKCSRSQESRSEPEVLARQMGPEEQLKCEFLLLELYRHVEGSNFKKIPSDNYIEVASRCLKEFRMLDNIKMKLNEKGYPQVKWFVHDVLQVFQSDTQSTNHNDSDLPQEKFKKNFKEMFGIQETMENSALA